MTVPCRHPSGLICRLRTVNFCLSVPPGHFHKPQETAPHAQSRPEVERTIALVTNTPFSSPVKIMLKHMLCLSCVRPLPTLMGCILHSCIFPCCRLTFLVTAGNYKSLSLCLGSIFAETLTKIISRLLSKFL